MDWFFFNKFSEGVMSGLELVNLATRTANEAKKIAQIQKDRVEPEKINALQTLVRNLQDQLMEAHQAHIMTVQRMRELENMLKKEDRWAKVEAAYEEFTLPSGALVFISKSSQKSTQPPHHICPRCY